MPIYLFINFNKLFLKYDEDLDHLLNINEYNKFITDFIPLLSESEKNNLFNEFKKPKKESINYQEFKLSLNKTTLIGRIKDLFNEITIIEER